jgi:hypothetical protein
MKKLVSMRWPDSIAAVASIALALVVSSVAPSSAACGGYCEARQVRAMCHHAVASPDLSARERDAEFEKCASDSLSFLIRTVQGGAARLGLDRAPGLKCASVQMDARERFQWFNCFFLATSQHRSDATRQDRQAAA